MADLPGRPAERRLRLAPLPLLVATFVAPGAVFPAAAQETPDPGAPRAAALAQVGGGLTSFLGRSSAFLEGAALVVVGPRLAVGGGGTWLPTTSDVEGDVVFPDREIGFGYGGVIVELRLPWPGPRYPLALRTLVGAGNADLHDRRTGTRLASDNMVVVEPALLIRRPLSGRLSLGASLSWRAILGLEDVQGLRAADLATPSIGVHLRLGRF